MCGILSVFSLNESINKGLLSEGLKTLHHRGPDHSSFWMSSDQKIALGHTRLSIIDLNTGDQPISNHDDTLYLVANGEFYDFERIRHELQVEGYQFKTSSDSEIALHLYQKYGTACLKYLRGEFAFTIWDSVNGSLFAARDRLGINPIYYAQHDEKIFFASEIKALIAAGVPAIWDEDSYLNRSFFFQDRTLFKGIYQLPPGHFALATSGGIKQVKYWDFNYKPDQEIVQRSEEEHIESLRDSLLQATETRLRADVPVGVYLSGGIDSCGILGMTSHLRQNQVDAFTLSFADKNYDEAIIAGKMAKKVGASHHIIPVNQEHLADNFSQSIWHSETLCMNAHSVAKFMLSKAVSKQGFKVVLTGEGADEIFAGYSSFRSDLLQINENPDSKRLMEEIKNSNKVSAGLMLSDSDSSSLNFLVEKLGYKPSWLPPINEIYQLIKSCFNSKTEKFIGKSNPIEHFINTLDFRQLDNINPVHQSMYMLSKSALPNYILTNLGDRMEMANSLEGRLPFLDHMVIEQVVGMPVSMKIKGITEKYVLREALKPFVIEQVYNREKHPFLAPPSVITPGEKLHQLVQDTLRSTTMDRVPYFNKKRVIEFLDHSINQPESSWPSTEAVLLEMLSLCLLQQHFELTTSANN